MCSSGSLGRTKANQQSGLGNCYHSVKICLQAPENHKIKNLSFPEDIMLHPIKNVTSLEILKLIPGWCCQLLSAVSDDVSAPAEPVAVCSE
jgi:hypothetical protein